MAYEAPAPEDLILRYSAFAAVDEDVIQYWLTDSERFVDETWLEADYAVAIIEAAAHNMTLEGHGSTGASSIPAGVTRFKSGAVDITVSDSAANRRANEDWNATRYGQRFLVLRRRSLGGPRLVPDTVPACEYPLLA